MNETQRDEMIDTANEITELINQNADLTDTCIELLEAIKPFVEAGKGVEWETTKHYYKFYPVNSSGAPLSMGDLRRVMEVYEKYREGS